jgi:hypothetical protein
MIVIEEPRYGGISKFNDSERRIPSVLASGSNASKDISSNNKP